jgi:hypothetical protein
MSGHYFDRAWSLPTNRFTWEMDGHGGSAPSIPVWKTGVCLSTLMPEEMACQPEPAAAQKLWRAIFAGEGWSPVRELHPRKRFCRPPPELLG